MKRCNACRRYAADHPPFCPYCGRSYSVRLCPRGHVSPRHVEYCAQCGSGDLSTPAPPDDVLVTLSRWTLRLVLWVALFAAAGASVAGILAALDWQQLAGPLIVLGLFYGLLTRTSTLLPGPLRSAGRTAGRGIRTVMRNKR